MADDNPAGGAVKATSPTEADVERIARRAADEAVAAFARRLGIDPERVEKWHSLFGEVDPIQAREAIFQMKRRQEAMAGLTTTMRSSLVLWILAGIIAFVGSGALASFKEMVLGIKPK